MSIQIFLLQAVTYFVFRQIKKYAESIDWNLVKADAMIRIAQIVPGEQFDGAAKTLVSIFIDFVEEYFTGRNLDEALEQARLKIGY